MSKDYNFQNFSQNKETSSNKMLITIAVSMIFLTIWNNFFSPSKEELEQMQREKTTDVKVEQNENLINLNRNNKLITKNKEKKQIFIENDIVKIGIDTNNNNISYLMLKKYKKHEKSNDNVLLLDDEHFIDSGFISNFSKNDINWKLKERNDKNIIVYGEKDGFIFENNYILQDDYIIEVEQKVINKTGKTQNIKSYTRASLKDTRDRIENSYAFRGLVSNCNSEIKEKSFDDIKKLTSSEQPCEGRNWISLSDQYWLTAVIHSDNTSQTKQGVRYNNQTDKYQIDVSGNVIEINNNEEVLNKMRLYIGPKNLDVLNQVKKKYNIDRFDKTIDFGIFYFIAKPLLIIIKKLYSISGNFGIAIILMTILIRMIIFPLANRSYKATSKIKTISPELKELQEKYKNDKKALQVAIYDLYKRKGINPGSAIVPILLQIPIFFALYKVLIISIEMRDAPFMWIKDLSTKDPTSFINLFGLLPFEAPSFFQIGILPCIMGITMFIQQKITPQATMEKTQQMIMLFMPLIFLIMFSGMPAGLILYWSCSNIFTIIQQSIIMYLSKESNNDYVKINKHKK